MGAISKHEQQPERKGIKLMTPNVQEVFTCSYSKVFFDFEPLKAPSRSVEY